MGFLIFLTLGLMLVFAFVIHPLLGIIALLYGIIYFWYSLKGEHDRAAKRTLGPLD